jgi:L-asparaginase II
MSFGTELLVEVRRGDRVESEHRGAIAVVDVDGRLLAHLGEVSLVTYLRSSAKPFQLLPLIESGAADRFGLTDQELAVIAGSHSGEPRHVKTVQSILTKIGLGEDALLCGAHVPFNPEAAQALRAAGREPTALYNNCSGKHAGMLAQAVDRGLSTHDYLERDHPVQVTILRRLAALASVPVESVGVGIDGCSVPSFALSLQAAALAFARLADARDQQPTADKRALGRVAQVMLDYPEMVAGEGRLDTDLMRAAKGLLIGKGGAEGFHGIGVRAHRGRPAFGIAFKIGDGDGKRGGHPAVIEALKQLDLLDDDGLSALRSYQGWVITNHRGLEVGEVRANFQLQNS